MVQRYDIAIVGSGPAGLSASLNACVRKKKFIIFGNKNYSDKLIKAVKINNYLGLSGKSGVEFKNEIDKQLSLMNIVVTEEKVNTVFAMGSYFIIVSDKGTYEAKTVILATGISFEGAIDGEKEYLGRGVSYCVTCDAQLCKNKVSTIPYNTLFFEACEEAKVPDLFLRLRNVNADDRNAFFLAEIKRVVENIIYRLKDLQMKM